MKFALFLDASIMSHVVVEQNPSNHLLVPAELVYPGEKLVGISTIQNGRIIPLNAYFSAITKRVIEPSIKIISPPGRFNANVALVYQKSLNRPMSQLFCDEYGFGSIDAQEINPYDDIFLRKRTVAFINVKEPYPFFRVEIDVEYEGSFIFYQNPRYPIPFVPLEIKEDENAVRDQNSQ